MSAQISRRQKPQVKSDKAFTLLVVYLFFEYIRIQDSMLPFLAPLKIPMFLLIGLTVVLVKKFDLLKKDVFFISLLVLLLEMALWVPFAVNNYFAYSVTLSMFMIVISVFAIIVIVDNEEKLKSLINYWVIINFVLAIWVMTHGGRGTGGFLADENDVCVALIAGFPFAFNLAREEGIAKSKKIFYYLSCFLITVGVILTSSRGGFLGFVAMIFVLLWYSQNRVKNISYILVFTVVFGSIVLQSLPEGYVEDMESISDTEDNTRNLRYLHWTTAWEMFKDNPVLGVGPGNYPWRSYEYFHLSPYYDPNARGRAARQSHSLYFTLIPELGGLGIFIFFRIFITLVSRLRKKVGFSQEQRKLNVSFISALAGIFISGAFVSVLYYPILWHILAMAICALNVSEKSK